MAKEKAAAKAPKLSAASQKIVDALPCDAGNLVPVVKRLLKLEAELKAAKAAK